MSWRDTARTVPQGLGPGMLLATEKQVSYLNAMRDGKDTSALSPEQRAWLADADFSKIARHRASDVIEVLKELPWAAKDSDTKNGLPEVPDGRYAIAKPDGTLMFYSVKKGTHTTFVDVWASDARWPIKAKPEKIRILKAIANDPDAGPRFGREIKRCYICGRSLTRRLSREMGIGPICGERTHEEKFTDMERAARESLIAQGIDPDEELDD